MTTDAGGLYRLMAWLSPSYPVGAFTLSHGLEWAVEDGTVANADGLAAWVGDVLVHGAGRQDAILLAAAYRARTEDIGRAGVASGSASSEGVEGGAELPQSPAHSRESGNPGPRGKGPSNPPWIPAFAGMSGVKGEAEQTASAPVGEAGRAANRHLAGGQTPGVDAPSLAAIVELAAALNPSRERRVETLSQGEAFRKITGDVWASPVPWPDGPLAYPVAVAIAAADHGVALDATLTAYLHAFAANIVSAGVRLVPLGQTDGQATIARLEPAIARIADAAAHSTLDDLGGSALLADIASMRHETQYTRLFRT
ncbi:urease accessory protein UreF [Amorphus sp. MBR-141]